MNKLNGRRITGSSFTLLEMLIVIVIIGILAALLIPVVGKAKWRAWDAKCKANLKNLQVATMNRAFDCEGRLPYAQSWEVWGDDIQDWRSAHGWVHWRHQNKADGGGSHTKSVRNDWTQSSQSIGCSDWTPWWGLDCWRSITNGTIWEYTGKSLAVYSCPVFVSVAKYEPNSTVPIKDNRVGVYAVRSYAMNSQISNKKISELEPSKRALFADTTESIQPAGFTSRISERYMRAWDMWPWDGELICKPWSSYVLESIGQYHNSKGNVIFVDGHVESLTWQQATNACRGSW